MLCTAVVMLGSLALTTAVVAHAYYLKHQFYPTVVYLTKSSPSMAVSTHTGPSPPPAFYFGLKSRVFRTRDHEGFPKAFPFLWGFPTRCSSIGFSWERKPALFYSSSSTCSVS